MAQYDFGTINTATTTGGDLATLLQNWRDAVLSNHSGTSRPAYVKPGQIWVNTIGATNWVINLYDGVSDIPLGYVNPTDDSAGFLTRAVVTTKSASANIAITERDMLVGVTATAANLAMFLPTAISAKNGFRIAFQKLDNTANVVTIARSGSDLINGATFVALSQQYESASLISDGASSWYSIGALIDSTVGTSKLVNGAVTTAKIADANVTTAKIADAGVTTAKIADANVTTSKIADGNVTTDKIADANVTTNKIANASITPAKLNGGQSGSAPIYAARAWVQFNGTGVSPLLIYGSGNVSSITDNGVGDYSVVFITPMSTANYAYTGCCTRSNYGVVSRHATVAATTTVLRIQTTHQNGGLPVLFDPNNVSVMVME